MEVGRRRSHCAHKNIDKVKPAIKQNLKHTKTGVVVAWVFSPNPGFGRGSDGSF